MRAIMGVVMAATELVSAYAAEPAQVPYPTGYRDWHHVKSMVINSGHPLYQSFGGIHHLYANKKAVEGYRKGRFPDGAVIVFDLLEAKTADDAVTEGPRKVVGVMHRDAKKFRDTGGWGFEGFKGDSRTERAVGKDAATACYQCHAQQKDKDFVFSSLRP
ncbi:MAG: cytochrome P460 family protein [Burkholderiales bacterium]|nr:cytochrome P460 family protein [Burkholderiales bacterium]